MEFILKVCISIFIMNVKFYQLIPGFEDDSNFGVNYPHIGMSN